MKNDVCELYGILFRHGKDDLGLWELDLPESAVDEIEKILVRYLDTGCSTRGSKKDIANEIIDM